MSTPRHDPAPRRRSGAVVALAVALVAGLAACGGSADDAPPATQQTSPAGDDPGSATGIEATADGCEATDDGPPSGAEPHEIVDVDGDGQADTAWLSGGEHRSLGITTASGGTFSIELGSASPERASAVVEVVATAEGTAPVALVDTGRAVRLFSVAGCELAATEDAEGEPYTFDKGFTGEGTGVECLAERPTIGGDETTDELHLARLNADGGDDGSAFTVTRTFIDLSADAKAASDGVEEIVVEAAPADDRAVTAAQRTSCGDLVAGEDGPVEPAP